MDTAFRHRVNAAKVAVQNQTAFFRHQFGQVPSEWKADETRVTFADFAISERIFSELRASFPEDDYASEETNPLDEVMNLDARYTWILDPIDGTNNYALGLPFCGISLALFKDGFPVYGLIYDFARDRLIHGGPGEGLCDGPRRVQPGHPPLSARESIISVTFPLPLPVLHQLEPLLSVYRVRATGSTALNLAYTALGLSDGCVAYLAKIWDIAAGCALLAASGRRITFPNGPLFPLRTFHVDAPRTPFLAGTEAFLARAGAKDAVA